MKTGFAGLRIWICWIFQISWIALQNLIRKIISIRKIPIQTKHKPAKAKNIDITH